jgi:SAM-dependent methyltransferase
MSTIEMQMSWSRYSRLRSISTGAVVLEVGCGQGLATDYISSVASSFIQIDYSFLNTQIAHSENNANVVCASADRLPIADASVDVVAALEMFYYLSNQEGFLSECRRVLSPTGMLYLTMPNPARKGFHRSPHSTRYPTAAEIHHMMADAGFEAKVEMAFAMSDGVGSRALRSIFALAEKLRLVPRSLKGRARLKRVIQGKTTAFPGLFELGRRFEHIGDGVATSDPSDGKQWSLIYVTARLRP